MIEIILCIFIIIGFNMIPQLTKKRFPKTKKLVGRILICITVIFILQLIFSFNGLNIRGIYSNPIIGLMFVLTSLMYFTITKNTMRKIVIILAVIPLILLNASLLVFNKNLGEYKVTENMNLVVRGGGFLGCGEVIRLTTPKFLIFDKELIYDNNLCLIGINKVEILEMDEKLAKLLIYHGREKDSENPYHYVVENKNMW